MARAAKSGVSVSGNRDPDVTRWRRDNGSRIYIFGKHREPSFTRGGHAVSMFRLTRIKHSASAFVKGACGEICDYDVNDNLIAISIVSSKHSRKGCRLIQRVRTGTASCSECKAARMCKKRKEIEEGNHGWLRAFFLLPSQREELVEYPMYLMCGAAIYPSDRSPYFYHDRINEFT